MSNFLSLGKSSHLSDWDFHLSWPPWFPSEQKGKKEQNWHIQGPLHIQRWANPAYHKQSWLQSSVPPFHRHLLRNTLVLPGTALLVHLNILPRERKVEKNHYHVQFLIHSFGQREKSMRTETPIFSLALQNICEQAYVCTYICKTAVISEVCVKRSQRDGKQPAHPQLSPYFQLWGVLRRSRSSKTEAENICWEIKKKINKSHLWKSTIGSQTESGADLAKTLSTPNFFSPIFTWDPEDLPFFLKSASILDHSVSSFPPGGSAETSLPAFSPSLSPLLLRQTKMARLISFLFL